MAIWQYHITVVPQEEIESYFNNKSFVKIEAIESIDWWKYRKMEINQFIDLENLLPVKKSWSNDIILFGSEESNCIEVLMSNNKVEEISIRIDLRADIHNLVDGICIFFGNHNCVFLDYQGKIIIPHTEQFLNEVKKYSAYNDFLRKVNRNDL